MRLTRVPYGRQVAPRRSKLIGGTLVVNVILLCAWGGIARSEIPQADLVLRNGRIVTVDPARPEAQALAVLGERILAVGNNEEIAPYVGERTEVIDLQQRLAVPGFIEAHAHLLALGEALTTLDLSSARTWEELVATVAQAARKARAAGSLFATLSWPQVGRGTGSSTTATECGRLFRWSSHMRIHLLPVAWKALGEAQRCIAIDGFSPATPAHRGWN